MPGTFICVGVGPGDPELLTLKAVGAVRESPVIAAPKTRGGRMLALDIVSGAVDLSHKVILPLDFPMERDTALCHLAHREAAGLVREHLDAGRDVAMLSLGDVSVYASCCYVMELLKGEGYPVRMIPGVPSFCAVAAALGESLTTMNSLLHILPAGGVSLEEALKQPGTKVLMKAGRRMEDVQRTLKDMGLEERAVLVENCGLPDEKIQRGLGESRWDAGYFSTIVIKE